MEENDSEENKNLEREDSKFFRNFQSDMKEMFNNSVCSDIKILIDYKVIRGHKLILLGNPSFSKMIASNPDLKEIYFSDQISDSVERDIRHLFCDNFGQEKEDVLQFSSEACETFLRYLYGMEVKKEMINLDLMLVAYKFSDEMLKDFCQKHLIKDVNVRNAVRTLLVSLETQSEKLKIEACKLIARNFNEMKFNQDLNLILENEAALSEILNVFDDCETILLKSKMKDENLEYDSLNQLRSTDLMMTVGNHHFLAHKKILSERNAVFKVIIDAASSDGFPTSVNIPDVDHKSFKIFLHFIYTDEVNRYYVSDNLLKLAHMYTDDKLKEICEIEFIQKLDYDNAIKLLFVAMKFECKHLQKCALNYILVRYEEISSQDDYQKLVQNLDATNLLIRTLRKRLKPDIENAFSNIRFILKLPNTYIESEPFEVENNILWIKVIKQSSDGTFWLGFSLYINSPEPNVCLCFSLKLISATDKQYNIVRKTARDFKKSKNGWGWPELILWSELEDPEYGYINDGKITFEIDVTVI